MYKNIEFVCTGNNGRSPIGEQVAKRVAGILGLQDRINISSSGTLVDQPTDTSKLKDSWRPFIQKAVDRGILENSVLELFETDPLAAGNLLKEHEQDMRNAYLTQSLGSADVGYSSRQTVVRPEADLILPMDGGNLERIAKIYADVDHKPRIETLGLFSGLEIDLAQDFPEVKDEYIKTAVNVEAATRAAMVKIVDYL